MGPNLQGGNYRLGGTSGVAVPDHRHDPFDAGELPERLPEIIHGRLLAGVRNAEPRDLLVRTGATELDVVPLGPRRGGLLVVPEHGVAGRIPVPALELVAHDREVQDRVGLERDLLQYAWGYGHGRLKVVIRDRLARGHGPVAKLFDRVVELARHVFVRNRIRTKLIHEPVPIRNVLEQQQPRADRMVDAASLARDVALV